MKNKFEITGDETKVFIQSKSGIIITLINTKSLEILNDFDGTFRACWNEKTNSYYVTGYDNSGSKRKNVMMHRWIMCANDGMVVDHKNHDTLDNRTNNLRVTTQTINMHNRDLRKVQGRVLGVQWIEVRKKWRAYISVNKKGKHLGYFKEKEDAINAVDNFKKNNGLSVD